LRRHARTAEAVLDYVAQSLRAERMIRMTLPLPRLTRILITLFALGPSLTDARGQPKACGSEIRSIEVNQTTLHYFECGSGEPLIFVHGGLGGLHTFQPHAQTFATSFRVIAYSRRYYPPNSPLRAEDGNPFRTHVADLAALVKTLNATPVHLVAHSGGAYIGLALAVEHPDLVRSLVLGEPPVLPLLSRTSVGEAARQSWVDRVLAPTDKALESGDVEEGLRRFFDGICGAPCFDRFPESRRTELVVKHGPAFRSEILLDVSAPQPPLACERLRRLKRPTLLLTGERSPAVFLLTTAELERCLEGESQVMVPKAGHGMHGDNPTFYNQTVMAFLRRR
jgi:non-heme chloroperoxidase